MRQHVQWFLIQPVDEINRNTKLIMSGPRLTYQNLHDTQVLDLVAAQVEVRQVWTFLHQCIQASGDGVVTDLQLINEQNRFHMHSSN